MSCGIGCRCDSDPQLLWLWYRPADVALIQPLVWELPHAVGVALRRKRKRKRNKKGINKFICITTMTKELVDPLHNSILSGQENSVVGYLNKSHLEGGRSRQTLTLEMAK